MSRRVRLPVFLAWVVVLAGLVPAAQAQSEISVGSFIGSVSEALVSYTTIPAQVSGQLTVTFRGDAASGCGAEGVCPYSGTIVVHPGRAALLVWTFRRDRRLVRVAELDYGTGNAPYLAAASVQRSIPSQPDGVCADTSGSQEAEQSPTAPIHNGAITIRFLDADTTTLSTRCAGPLDGDVAAVGPQTTIPLRTALRGHLTLDLSGTRTFATHGFAGTVSSTLVLRFVKAHRTRVTTSPPGTQVHRIREVIQQLELVGVAGSVTAAIHGTTGPIVCRLLDSCGLTETLSVTPHVGPATAYLSATGSASRPYRDFLVALGLSRAGRSSGIQTGSVALLSNAGEIRAALGGSGACTDSAPLNNVDIFLARRAGRWTGSFGSDSWRTRCPGPMLAGQNPVLQVDTPVRATSGRVFTIELRPVSRLEDDGYSVSLSGHLSITFRRGRITQTVISEPVGS